jgi:hypothetical protein
MNRTMASVWDSLLPLHSGGYIERKKSKMSKKCFKMFINVLKCLKMILNMFINVPKCLKMFQNVPKCRKMFKHVSKSIKIFQNISTSFKNLSKSFKIFQNVPKCSKIIKIFRFFAFLAVITPLCVAVTEFEFCISRS